MRYFLKACALTLALVFGLIVGSAAWEFSNDPHNHFVNAFNAYTESLNRGVMDLKKVHKMRAAWRELEKSAGWPDETKR